MRASTILTGLVLSAASVFAAPTGLLEGRQSCPDVLVYFSRGTTEPGTFGNIIGPHFSDQLKSQISGKNVAVTGIAYLANIGGYLAGGDAGGARTMANSVTSTADSCPNTKVVISGYSQGAQVTHLAARQLSSAIQNRIVAVVTFGDPYESTALPGILQSRRKTFCNGGDFICSGSPIVLPPHLTYGSDASAAAAFVKARV